MSLLTIILQVALGILAEHPSRAGGNLCGYFPQDTTVSVAPKGYSPFYISHIARHGSRFMSSRYADCFQVADSLAYYDGKGMLTEDGLALMEDIRTLHRMADGRYGDLTSLGAQEHRDICARMVRHYPEVFTDPARQEVVTWSTASQRVQDSRTAFTGELLKRMPALHIDEQSARQKAKSYGLQEVTGYPMTKEERAEARTTEKNFSSTLSELRKGYHFDVFAGRIFLDPSAVPARSVRNIAIKAFRALKTACVNEGPGLPDLDKYFTVEELYYLWIGGSMPWCRYLNFPGYTYPITAASGGGILECIVKDADQALASGSPVAATLRFSHDTYLLPLMATIPFEGTVLSDNYLEIPEHFQDFNFVCPACNVQLIFYRSADGPVLVKFLLNEKESLIHGLAPLTGRYYKWDKVKKFWRNR